MLTRISTRVLILVGLALVFWQMHRIGEAVRAAGMYEIHKDSRQLVEKSQSIPGFFDYLSRGDTAEVSGEDQQRYEAQMNLLVDFYLSVYRQDREGVLSRNFSRAFRSEFCNFVKANVVQSYWKRKNAVGEFHGEYNKMRKRWCGS